MPNHVYGAVDIGGTKIAAGLVDADGELVYRLESATPRGSAEQVLATVVRLVEELAQDPRWSRVAGVGIGSAGPVDPTRGTVSPVNIPAWRDFPLVEHVAASPAVAAGRRVVTLTGDGSAMAAGEHWRGAARGYDDALCLVVSTGVGAGLILDGALRTGPSGNAGHLGHVVVDTDGEDCPCGSRGCVETIASGTSIARWALQQGWSPDRSSSAAGGSGAATAAEVALSAVRGDEIALAAFDRAGRALAAVIAGAAALTDLRVAVVGGGVAKAGPLLFDPLRRHLARYASLPFTRDLKVLPAALGGDAGLVGAAAAVAAVVARD